MRDDSQFIVQAVWARRKIHFLGASILAAFLLNVAQPAFSQNWTPTLAPTNAWASVGCSADGTFIVATTASGGIFASVNSGTNWSLTIAPTNGWGSVACSTNGSNIIALGQQVIWYSTNEASTWVLSSAPSNNWSALACSADGANAVASVGQGGIWTSSDFGSNWNLTSAPQGTENSYWVTVSSSADGSKLMAVSSGIYGQVYTSSDFGNTWTPTDAARLNWQSGTCSADGTKLAVAFCCGGYVYISTNGGANWTQSGAPDAEYGQIVSSSDGTKLAALGCALSQCPDHPILYSADSAVGWTTIDDSGPYWVALAFAKNGNELIAAATGGGISIWQPIAPVISAPVQSSVVPSATNVELSVGVGSVSPLDYQWQFDGTDIPDATNSALNIANVTALNSGTYTVLITNAIGDSTTSSATVTVTPSLLSTELADPSLHAAHFFASATCGADSTTVWFEWGTDTNYGNVTPPTKVQGPVTATISNLVLQLEPYTTYHYQAVASNIFGIVYGGDTAFTTVPKFVQVGTNSNWSAMALSGDGRELAATSNGVVCVSTNFGLTFSPTEGTGLVFATSFDGSVILAENGASVETSMDRGLTWTSNATPMQFSVVAASSNAQVLIGSQGSTNVFVSTNFGSTWSNNAIPVNALCVTPSPDGKRLFVASEALTAYYPPPLYYWVYTTWVLSSTDDGESWITNWSLQSINEPVNPANIACSSDASVVVLATLSGIEISTNDGTSWYQMLSINHSVESFSMSGSGQAMIEGIVFFGPGVSPNGGVSWFAPNVPGLLLWSSESLAETVFSSTDSNTLAIFTGSIYLTVPPPTQPFSLARATIGTGPYLALELSGEVGYTYIIEASTNLLDWQEVGSVAATNGIAEFNEALSTNGPTTFYRAVAQF